MELLVAMFLLLAKDDGRWAQSPNRDWFNGLQNKAKQNCCSRADGIRLEDPKWEQTEKGYRVFLDDTWIDVPDEKIVDATNEVGYAMVWPVYGSEQKVLYILCFMPGSRS